MKQHYIPRFYLKRFSESEKFVSTYDKKNSKIYQASLMSVCFEHDMYTISDSFVKESNKETGGNINSMSIEQGFFADVIEDSFKKYLSNLDLIKSEWENGSNYYVLTDEEKYELAMLIVIQYLRHPLLQKVMIDNIMRMETAQLEMVKEMMAVTTGKQEFRDLKVEPTCEESVLHATTSYMNIETLKMFSLAITNNIFMFWISKDNDFYTSDFPIVVCPHAPEASPMFMGLAQYGGEVSMPLSPSLCLSIYDREFFKDLKSQDCCFLEASDKEVRKQNLLRYMYAQQHVFSFKNDFRMIDFWHQIQGGKHIFHKPNHRAEIVSGLGRY